jgi:hypothetical protein
MDDVQGITLKLTEEDIRLACTESRVPFAGLVAIWRRFRSQDEAIQMADVLYLMALAKSKNLNPLDNNYSLIPRSGNKGFSLTFTKDAALQVITNHPRVKPGSLKRFFISKGQRLEWSKSPGHKNIGPEFDWELEAHITVEDREGLVLEGVAKFRNVYSSGNDGNPKPLWVKDQGGMTMKQAYKDLANTQFGGGLPDEEDLREGAIDTSATVEPQRSLPATTNGKPQPTPEQPQAAPGPDMTSIVAKGEQLGMTAETTLAAFTEAVKMGVEREAFERKLDEEIATRGKKAEKKPGRARKAAEPVITIVGTIDGISERRRTVERKEGEPEKPGQKYLVLAVGQQEFFMWDSKWFEVAFDCLGFNGKPQPKVKIGYTTSQKDDKVFYEVKEFEVLADEPQAQPEPEPPKAEESPAPTPEPPKEKAAEPSPKPVEQSSFLF